MTTPRLIACVGELASSHRIEDDLGLDARDRRLLIVRTDNDCYRLRGLRGDDLVCVDMGASWYQLAFCRLREFRKISIEEARELLKPPQERIPGT